MDKLQICNGIICAAYHAADGRNIDIENFLIKETELVSELAKGSPKWGQSDYLLHIICWTLRDRDCQKILRRIPHDNIAALKEAFVFAQQQKFPDTEAATNISTALKNKSLNPTLSMHDKYRNNIKRFSALIALKVAIKWKAATAELNKWYEMIDRLQNPVQESENIVEAPQQKPVVQQTTPAKTVIEQPAPNETLWTFAELAQKLGQKDSLALHHKKKNFLKQHPEYKEQINGWFMVSNKGKRHLLFKAEHFDELKQLMCSKQKRISNVVSDESSELWAIKELAQKLGLTKVKSFYTKRCEFIAKHPEYKEKFESWFIPSNKDKRILLFKSEHFNELNQLMKTDAHHAYAVLSDNEELWTIEELAQKLGLKRTGSFYTKRCKFVANHPESKEKFESWFLISKAGKQHLLFKAKYFDELKALFNTPTQTQKKTNHRATKKIDDTTTTQQSKSDTVKSVVEKVSDKTEQPTNLVDIKKLELYLTWLTKKCEEALEIQNDAEKLCEDLQKQMTTAEEAKNKATAYTQEIKDKIKHANDLLHEWTDAELALNEANKIMSEKNTKINEFLQNIK